MKQISFLLVILTFWGCSHKNNSDQKKDVALTSDSIPNLNKADILLDETHQKLTLVKGDYKDFKKFISALDPKNILSIAIAADYIKTSLKDGKDNADSAYVYFYDFFYTVNNNASDSLTSYFPETIGKWQKNKEDDQVKRLVSYLDLAGMDIFSSEGMCYLDVQPDYFYNLFNAKVSSGLNEFLSIREQELKEGFSEDAGMKITFNQLYERVKQWENLMAKYPNFPMRDMAHYYYDIYLSTLLTGMDNSRVFDGENQQMLPEVKVLFSTIKSKTDTAQSTKVISAYYTFLEENNFTYNDKINEFLKEHGMSTMLGVQPHLR